MQMKGWRVPECWSTRRERAGEKRTCTCEDRDQAALYRNTVPRLSLKMVNMEKRSAK